MSEPDQYTPLQIATILPGRTLQFDLYIFFKEQYIVYADRNAKIDQEKLSKLKSQKIARFYITRDDEANYQQFLNEILSEAENDPLLDIDKKADLVEGAVGTAIEAMGQDPASEASFNMTKRAAKSLFTVVQSNPDFLKKVYGRPKGPLSNVIKHSLNVCALATKFASENGFSELEIDDLGTAALIHDIGLTKLDKDSKNLFMKPSKAFTPDDKRIYNIHVADAEKLLEEKSYVTKSVLDLVVNHEENLTGSGPKKLKKLAPLQGLLNLVNCYDKKVMTQKISPKAAMKEFQIDEVGNYDLKMINKFKKFLKAQGLFDD